MVTGVHAAAARLERFVRKQAVSDAVDRVITLLSKYERGEVVLWELIEDAAGYKRDHPHWTAIRKRFQRDFLRRHDIDLYPLTTRGLSLPTLDQQLYELPRRRSRKAARQHAKTERSLYALPDSELTEHQRDLKVAGLEAAARARRASHAVSRAVTILLGEPVTA